MNLEDDIKSIQGIGDKTAAAFLKLNIETVDDLIHTFPRNYLSYDEPINIADASEGYRQAFYCTISSFVMVKNVRGLTISAFTVNDGTKSMKITFFNSPYIKHIFKKGDFYVFVGVVKKKGNSVFLDMPEYFKMEQYKDMLQEMQPVYPLTKGLNNKTIKKAVLKARDSIAKLDDYLSPQIREQEKIMELADAYDNIHFPMNETVLKNAIRRIAFDEFYSFMVDMNKIKNTNIKLDNTHVVVQGKAVLDFINELPYRLTKGQALAVEDILSDMGSDTVMNRLIQGDVGSGKTIVGVISLFACVKSRFQGVLMAPTEVLAKQHFDEISKMLDAYGIRTACLVGSVPLKEKRRIYKELEEGNIDILIGTHAVIEDKVHFYDLGLVITDEQHRFGVNQRKKLSDKGNNVHTLVMSATPIPRTLAIIMYADLDISIIKDMPKGRKPIRNCVVDDSYRPKAHKFILDQVKEGSQAYVICPMVDESETMDITNVTEYTKQLKNLFSEDIKVCMLHGQMKAEEKNQIMRDYLDKKIDVLVSTTVIEVGINNPNSTVMLIENAERFGLAALHQLRGRVGRGNKQSYCIFINGKKSKESMERLKVLEESNDGFFIANEDLKQRGPGDFFGIRQSGEVLFNVADIYNHADMLKLAQDVFKKYGDLLENHKVYDKKTKTIL